MIAASGSLIGIGSDIGGSIRVPALFNGIFGHKPTPGNYYYFSVIADAVVKKNFFLNSGIIPIKGHFPMVENSEFQRYLTLGPMTRYAEDLHMAVKVMTKDCKKNLRLDEPVDIAKLNVFYLEDIDNNFGINTTSEDIRDAIRRAAKYFETCGAKISRVSFLM